jgi:uncharacterized protein (DUF2062 family)
LVKAVKRFSPLRGILQRIYDHLVVPFLESHAPIPQVSWGASIGIFVGLTPTMGIQMYIVAAIWMLTRFLFRVQFNLPIAVAIVWISNPVTFIPLYYLFLVTGNVFLGLGLGTVEPLDYHSFKEILVAVERDPTVGWLRGMAEGAVFLFWTFGWPMIVGSLIWAIPFTLVTYPATTVALLKYRRFAAEREGMSYEEWKRLRVGPE